MGLRFDGFICIVTPYQSKQYRNKYAPWGLSCLVTLCLVTGLHLLLLACSQLDLIVSNNPYYVLQFSFILLFNYKLMPLAVSHIYFAILLDFVKLL